MCFLEKEHTENIEDEIHSLIAGGKKACMSPCRVWAILVRQMKTKNVTNNPRVLKVSQNSFQTFR